MRSAHQQQLTRCTMPDAFRTRGKNAQMINLKMPQTVLVVLIILAIRFKGMLQPGKIPKA